MIKEQYLQISIELWGFFLCMVAIICIGFTRNIDKKGAEKLDDVLICDSLMLLNDVFALYFRGDTSRLGYYMVRISNFLCFAFSFIITSLLAAYLAHIIKKRTGQEVIRLLYFEYAVTSVGMILLVLSRLLGFMYAFDESNRYYRLPLYFIPALFGFLGLGMMLLMVMKYYQYLKKSERYAISVYLLLPLIAMAVQIFHYGISYVYIAMTISSIVIFVQYEMEYASYMVQAERELSDMRMRLLSHQIQPHFIFNSLTVIRYLCRDNAEAVETINAFAGYLRSSTDLLNETKCVSAERELETVKHYLYMEQKRFGEKLKVRYEIEETVFSLPAFSVQILVENAIRHGIRHTANASGTVTIRFYSDDNYYCIDVSDDGVGFDVESTLQQETSIGLMNTKKRLELMCGGILEITSALGSGTTATIRIPMHQK